MNGGGPQAPSTPTSPAFRFKRVRGGIRAEPEDSRVSQSWLDIRFRGLSPRDFSQKRFSIFTAAQLRSPPGFDNIWITFSGIDTTWAPSMDMCSRLSDSDFLLVFADLGNHDQVQAATQFSCFLKEFFHGDLPLVVVLSHSVEPEHRRPRDAEHMLSHTSIFFGNGIADVIVHEPESFKLCMEVQLRIRTKMAFFDRAHERLRARRRLKHMKEMWQLRRNHAIWDYMRTRLRVGLPEIDPDIKHIPERIGPFKICRMLGAGAYGMVYRLEGNRSNGEAMHQALKCMDKEPYHSIGGLRRVKRMINVMQTLSAGSGHPNVVKLFAIFQSESHLFFRMEYGGAEDLYKRLKRRVQGRDGSLSSDNVWAVLAQIIDGMSHLHAADVCHRDIKTENIVVASQGTDVCIKITDFDTAILNPPTICRGASIGTFPFTAPEVILDQGYNPFGIDVWSMAIVFLEVVCHIHVLEGVLNLNLPLKDVSDDVEFQNAAKMTLEIRKYFSQPSAVNELLMHYGRPDLTTLMTAVPMIRGMLEVESSERWDCAGIARVFNSCNCDNHR